MITRNSARLAIAVPLLALGAMSIAADGQQQPKLSAPACQLVVGDTIAIGQREYSVIASISDELGDTLTASFPAESNVAVAAVRRGNVPKTVSLSVNAESALPGDWKLTITGNGNACTGYVTVKQKQSTQTPVKKK